jgi:endonuclease-8
MAEGDTVHETASRVAGALAGRPLVRTDLRVPRFATADLRDRVLREVVAKGKHLLMRSDRGETIHSHLGMDGSWRVVGPGQRWRWPAHEVRAVLEVEGASAVGVGLRRLEVLRTAHEDLVVGHLGPDPLAEEWDAEEAERRLAAHAGEPLGGVLLDQTVIAGPGNVYRSEVCFVAGVDPRVRAGDAGDPAAIVELVRSLMAANRGGGRRSTTGDRRPGHELWVYGRAGRPCRRCGTPIVRLRLGGAGPERVAYVCPSCQPAAAASASTS